MICPVEIASEVPAFRAARVGEHAEHVLLHEGRDGAGDESTGSDFADDGEEDHVVASRGNYWHQRPAHAALARALRAVRLCRVVRPATGTAFAQAGSAGVGRAGVGTIPRAL